jgi:Zn-dependent protease with chaperone function
VGLTAAVAGTAVHRIIAVRKGGSTYLASVLKAVPLGGGGIFPSEGGLAQETMLKNVVSEMAIAAGMEEPEIYLLPNVESINAMAIGMSYDDRAVVLTKGALKYLNREEMSGLLAHEFSHLRNGDTSHYTLMSSYLHGLYCFQTLGVRMITKMHRLPIIIIGAVVIAVGLASTLMARILQSAFCRNREWLADATASQFTRDPSSLAAVLKKIGGQELPPRIIGRGLSEFTHLYAADPSDSLDSGEAAVFKFPINLSSHPPLAERIWALDPKWDGWYWDYEKNPVNLL